VPFEIPEGLTWWRSRADGAAWLDSLPGIVEACIETWGLRLGPVFGPGSADRLVGYVAEATLADGTEAVIKVNFPDSECLREPDVLAFWDGHGSVRLLGSLPQHRALLLERLRPGTQLWEVEDDDEATRYAAEAMRRIWRPAPAQHGFDLLSDAAAHWAEVLLRDYDAAGAPFERRMLDEALEACRTLPSSQGELVVVHQDLHGGNILQAEREPWLVIDPKPLVGEREFDIASRLRDRRRELTKAHGARLVQSRLDIFVDELGLDRQRARLWGLVHTLAWAADEVTHQYNPRMLHAAKLIWGAK
jgi:streptomycin 6-kinase